MYRIQMPRNRFSFRQDQIFQLSRRRKERIPVQVNNWMIFGCQRLLICIYVDFMHPLNTIYKRITQSRPVYFKSQRKPMFIHYLNNNIRWTIVQIYAVVFGNGDYAIICQAVFYTPYLIVVFGKGVYAFTLGQIPDLYLCVTGGRGKMFTILRK